MKIKIAERLRPFSLIPGSACVIPGSCAILEAFPTLLKIGGHKWPMLLTGPVAGFTLQQDLEKNCVYVFGRAKEGYFRLKIEAKDSGFAIESQRGPLPRAFISAEVPFVSSSSFERLSLGNHKAQDWDQVQRRSDLKEILPVLFCLGQKIPLILPQAPTGTAHLLHLPSQRKELEGALLSFFKASFKSLLVPRLFDDQYQGLSPIEPIVGNPFFLLQEGAKMIRSLFFQQTERRLGFLPQLPISFDAGRMLNVQAPGIGEIDFEWTKKTLRRVIVRATATGEVVSELQNEIKTFRVNKKRKMQKEEPLLLEAGKTYHLDRFEK
jgi:hypothetical protein